jgi:hypothetical protein
MSSTVTTTTISTVTVAASMQDWAQVFTLIVLMALCVVLLTKEITVVGQSAGVRRFTRGLDIALVPMLVAFVLILGLGQAG